MNKAKHNNTLYLGNNGECDVEYQTVDRSINGQVGIGAPPWTSS